MANDLVQLQEKVEKMLEGEKKRREVALRFIDKVTEIVLPVGPDMWDRGDEPDLSTDAVFLTRKKKDGKVETTGVYFRYKTHSTASGYVEHPGFYYEPEYCFPVWGRPIDELRGAEFWYGVQIILEWIPQLVEMIEKRQKGRAELLAKMVIEN